MENTVNSSVIFDGMTKDESLKMIENNKSLFVVIVGKIMATIQEEIKELNPKAAPVEVLIGAWKQLYSNAMSKGDKEDAERLKSTGKKFYYQSIQKEPSASLEMFFDTVWKTIKVK